MANAQTPASQTAAVGLPGCVSDVAVAASRAHISFSSQGRDISALLYEPQGTTPSGAAMVVLHGYDDIEILDNHALQMASRGFAVILPFYLQAERENDASRARAAHRAWRQVALDAAEAVAIESGVERNDVVLWGHSRGGGIALAAALEPGSPVGGAVSVNIGGYPQDDAQGTGRPFLLIHFARSSRLQPQQVKDMAEKIEERGGRVERLEIDVAEDEFARDDWCLIMDRTRGLLESVARPGTTGTTGG